MQRLTKVILFLATLNFIALNYFYSSIDTSSLTDLQTEKQQKLFTQEKKEIKRARAKNVNTVKELKDTNKLLKEILKEEEVKPKVASKDVSNGNNVQNSGSNVAGQPKIENMNAFTFLKAYPTIDLKYFEYGAGKKPFYNIANYQLMHDDNYCHRADIYNIEHPQNMFKDQKFFTDIPPTKKFRTDVIDKQGKVLMGFDFRDEQRKNRTKVYRIDRRITNFFLEMGPFHYRHEIGKHFLCVTQMYNRIPGCEKMIRKDSILDLVSDYSSRYDDKPHCEVTKIFPQTYRLYIKNECTEFFKVIQSETYKKNLKTEPIQYLVKVGHDSHKSDGVFLLDRDQETNLTEVYNSGKKCGESNTSLIAQAYISNPLLLDMNNKFDFRVYILVASTNPIIVYYHDGFARVALSEYIKSSKDRGVHLTNTHLAQKKFEEAKTNKVNGMNETELQDYHLWTFDRLEAYLLKSEKVKDPNWLDNYLRPAFKKAAVHIIRMSKTNFWKQSNVYQLFGLDFILDNEMNLWYIEGNPNPQLYQDTERGNAQMNLMLKNLLEIQFSYYRSRMSRLVKLVNEMKTNVGLEAEEKDYVSWQEKYERASKNKLAPNYKINTNNTWKIITDENLVGARAYYGHIKEDCL